MHSLLPQRRVARVLMGLLLLMLAAELFFLWRVRANSPRRELTVVTEPIPLLVSHIHPKGASPLEHGEWSETSIVVPEDLWVDSFFVSLEGVPTPQPYEWLNPMHQLSLEEVGVKDDWCAGRDALLLLTGNGIFRQGGKLTFAPPYAEFVRKGTVLRLRVFWHNIVPQTFHDLRAFVRLEGYRIKPDEFVNVRRYSITPAGCAGREVGHISIPAGAKNYLLSTKDHPLVFPENGRIIALGTHFHPDQKGKSFRVFLNGIPIYEFFSRAFAFQERDHVSIPPLGIFVQKGDTLTTEVVYDNPLTVPNGEAMAILSVFFAEKP